MTTTTTTANSTTPSVARMRNVVEHLAADEFTGRQAGTPGGHAAAQWLATHLTDLGADVTCEEFPVPAGVRVLHATPVVRWTDTSDTPTVWELEHRRDFAEHLASTDLPHPASGPLRTRRSGHNRGSWLLDTAFSAGRAAEAAAQGAVGIVVPRGVDDGGWMPKMTGGPAMVPVPVISVRDDIHRHMTAAAQTGTATLTASVPLRAHDITATNVYGVIRTAGPGQISVLLTAHFDGVGDDPNGLRHPAASDNASGVAAVIETARLLTDITTGIGIAVALLDGEESGLHGSARHAPQVPAGTHVINLDGAAAMDEPAFVEAGGPAHDLLLALDHAGRRTQIPLQAHALRSDHRRYAAAGLATVGIGMGMPGYQTPAETPDRVRPEALTAAVSLLLSTVEHLAAVSPEPTIAEIDRAELAELIQKGEITAVEALPEHVYAQGHLPGAVNIRPRRVAELAPHLLPDPAMPIAVYCGSASCDASLRAARHLARLGYTDVRRYAGGKHDWTNAGLTLE